MSEHDGQSHLPPQHLEAEEAVLGAMVMSLSAIAAAERVGLQRDHFYRSSHRLIWDAIMAQRDSGAGVDEITVVHRLKATMIETPKGKSTALSAVGGQSVVLSLAERVPAIANAEAYAFTVLGVATKRALVERGHAIAQLGYDDTIQPAEAVQQAERSLLEIVTQQGRQHQRGNEVDSVDSLNAWAAAYERRADPELYERDTVSWGLDELDERIGRMLAGHVYVFAGWTKHGKSWLVLDVLEAAMRQGHRVLLDSGEMSDLELVDRWVAMGGFNYTAVQEGRLPFSVTQRRRDEMAGWKRRTTSGRMSIDRLRSQVSRAKLEGKPFRVVAVDHLGLIRPGNGQGRHGRREFLEDACAELKSMAEEYGFTLILVSQLSRPMAERGKHPRYLRPPIQSDLKEASGIEQIATTVVFVYRVMSEVDGRFVDQNAALLFPFHRSRPTPKRLTCEFVLPGRPGSRSRDAYRFRPADVNAGSEPVVVEATAVQAALEGTFGPLTVVPKNDDDIPF